MLATETGFTKEEIQNLKDANIEPIFFKDHEEIWKYLEKISFTDDAIHLIRTKDQSLIPTLHHLKQKLGLAYAAARLYLDGQAADTQSRISAAIILNHVIPNDFTSFEDLTTEIEQMFILPRQPAIELTERGIRLLEQTGKIDGSNKTGYKLTDESFDPSSFQTGIDQFINDTLDLFKAATARDFPGSRDRLLEFIIEAIEVNCAALATGKGQQFEILNVSHLLARFLRPEEQKYRKDFEYAIRLGTKNITSSSAGTLRKLAMAASAFQLSFYSPEKVFGPMNSEVDYFILDANVVLPVLAHMSPDQSFNQRILAQLLKFNKPLLVTNGAIQEINAHLRNALEEYERLGRNDDQFTTGLYLASKHDTNAFQVAFSVLRESERITFTQYIDKYLKWRNENSLKNHLESINIKVLEKNRKREELERIAGILKKNLNSDSKKIRIPLLLDHDCEYVYHLQAELRFGLLTYDSELSRAIRLSHQFADIHSRIVNPVSLASFMELDGLPDIDCKAYIRKLLPTGKATIEDVVQTHYLSKALMDGHKLSLKDIHKVLSAVADELVSAAKKSSFDVHSVEELTIERATQILGYTEPRFVALARELDRNTK